MERLDEMKSWIELDLIQLKSLKKRGLLKNRIIEESKNLISKGVEKFGQEYCTMIGPQMNEFMYSIDGEIISDDSYQKINNIAESFGLEIKKINSQEEIIILNEFKNIISLVNKDYDFLLKLMEEILSEIKDEEILKDLTSVLLENKALLDHYSKRFRNDFDCDMGLFDIYLNLIKISIELGRPFNEDDIKNLKIIGKIEN